MFTRFRDISAHRTRMRNFLEAPEFSCVRRHLMLREALAEDKLVKDIANRNKGSVFDYSVMRKRLAEKSKETFYILGSGSSVEDLSPRDFHAISTNVSVGINAWVLHDFVPDIYSFEPVPSRSSDHFMTMRLLNRLEVFEGVKSIMFLKPRNRVELEQLKMVPPELVDRVMLYGRFQPFTRNPANLKSDLRVIRRLEPMNLSVLPDSGASILRMAFLAVTLGFSRIVFVGVDLKHTQYFWEKNSKYLDRRRLKNFDSGQVGSTHETLSNVNRAFGVISFLRALRDFGEAEGFNLEVASPKSLLADFLPVHDFDIS